MTDSLDELGNAAREGAGCHVCLDTLEHDLCGDRPDMDDVERVGEAAAAIGPHEGWQTKLPAKDRSNSRFSGRTGGRGSPVAHSG